MGAWDLGGDNVVSWGSARYAPMILLTFFRSWPFSSVYNDSNREIPPCSKAWQKYLHSRIMHVHVSLTQNYRTEETWRVPKSKSKSQPQIPPNPRKNGMYARPLHCLHLTLALPSLHFFNRVFANYPRRPITLCPIECCNDPTVRVPEHDHAAASARGVSNPSCWKAETVTYRGIPGIPQETSITFPVPVEGTITSATLNSPNPNVNPVRNTQLPQNYIW
jgi:hypothetical protein